MSLEFAIMQYAVSASAVLGISYLWAEFNKKVFKTFNNLLDSAFSSPKDDSSSGSNDDDSRESGLEIDEADAVRYLERLKNEKEFLKKLAHKLSNADLKRYLEDLKNDKEFLKELALVLSNAGYKDEKKTE